MLTLFTLLIVAGPSWQTINDEDGVKVETRDAGGGHVIVRGTKTVDIPAGDITAVLQDLERFSKWIPSLHTWTVVESNDRFAVVYARHELPWPMDDRDYRVRYVKRTDDKGRFSLEARSTKSAGPGPVEGVIRLRDVRSKWTITPLGSNKTLVAYLYHGDLGGGLPKTLVESVWKREPVVLFDALVKRVAAVTKEP